MRTKVFMAAIFFAAVVASPASATTYTLTAQTGIFQLSEFSITFNDRNGNRLLDPLEQTSFSGVSFFGHRYDKVLAVPTIANIATGGSQWTFANSAGDMLNALPAVWHYALSVAPAADPVSPTPLPSSLGLFALGLSALYLFRYKARTRTA